jgi:hypothetical protein
MLEIKKVSVKQGQFEASVHSVTFTRVGLSDANDVVILVVRGVNELFELCIGMNVDMSGFNNGSVIKNLKKDVDHVVVIGGITINDNKYFMDIVKIT